MRRLLLVLTMATATMTAGARAAEPVTMFQHWGMLREAGRCWAVAEPVANRNGANAAIVWRPADGVRGQLSIRLSRPRTDRAPVILIVDGRRFVLTGDATHAWASDARGDRAVAAAMRGARGMSVAAVDRAGRPFADVYPLGGAATALDAAALACRGG